MKRSAHAAVGESMNSAMVAAMGVVFAIGVSASISATAVRGPDGGFPPAVIPGGDVHEPGANRGAEPYKGFLPPSQSTASGSPPQVQTSLAPSLTILNPDPDPSFADQFGFAVAAVGGNLLVGAPNEDGGGPQGGTAYLFDGETGALLVTLGNPSPDPGDFFGAAVAAVGSTIVVGAPGDDTWYPDAGAVYVFDTAGTLLTTILSPGPVFANAFGTSIASLGDDILVGSPLHHGVGAAFLFDGDPASPTFGTRLGVFTKINPSDGDALGISVAAFGNRALVGAHGDDTGGLYAGAVYLFDGDPSSSTFGDIVASIPNPTPGPPADTDLFGIPVVALGTDVLVGASQDVDLGPTIGGAYLFDGDEASPTFEGVLHAFAPPTAADHFGAAIAVVDGNILIGAFRDDTVGFETGAAYLYDPFGNFLETYVNPNPDAADEFAFSVAAVGGDILIGAPREDLAGTDDGAVYLFYGLRDIDADGISDSVELTGVRDADGNLVADMAALGADPCRKTIAVEIDFMDGAADGHTHRPHAAAFTEVTDAFQIAPVPAVLPCPFDGFPTQPSGVNLVVDIDDPIAEAPTLSFGSGFETTKAAYFEPARAPYFHYSLWVHTLWGGGTSGIAEVHGNDFIVSLGRWSDQEGIDRQQSGTFMHELGHNLGLSHGGGDATNRKPNYVSVMSYSFQFGLLDEDTAVSFIDYSRAALPPLDEFSLNETAGIGDGSLRTMWHDLGGWPLVGRGDGPLDWTGNDFDGNGIDDDDSGVNVDVNDDNYCVDAGADGVLDSVAAGDDFVVNSFAIRTGPNHICETTAVGDDPQWRAVGEAEPNLLAGYDDWANLDYIFTDDYNYVDGVHIVPPEPEIDFQQAREMTRWYEIVRATIDVKPGGEPNSINCRSPAGVVPIGILSSADFDARGILASPIYVEAVLTRESHGRLHVEDLNGDGLVDAVVHLEREAVCRALKDFPLMSNATVRLVGETASGGLFEGFDTIRVTRRG